MPREDRRIVFNYDEVYKALFALCAQKEQPRPPPGTVIAVETSKADEKNVVVFLENPQRTKTSEVHYSRDFLAAALMMFCRANRIPLPKTASKTVELGKGDVSLRILM